jgi:hypothetical protein
MINLKFGNLLKTSLVVSLFMIGIANAEIPADDANLPENQCSVFTNKIMAKDITNNATRFVYLDNDEYISTNYIVTFIEKSGYVASMVVSAGGDIQSFCFQAADGKKVDSSASKTPAKAKK